MVLSVFWKEGERWVERPYQDFVRERVLVDGRPVEKPWTPSFVFHGSGAIHRSGTGCIACPCDCPGGIIADNRFPIYDPKPVVRFDLAKAPKPGATVYVRIRPVVLGVRSEDLYPARNRPDFAIAVIVNSSLQVALALTPVLVIASLLFATHLTLVFPTLLALVLLIAGILGALVINDGESTWEEGAVLVGFYVVIAASFWWGT